MAVTDMTESLPWWARGAMPQSQGPVAPHGASQQAWLDYLSSMFGVGSAQAGEAPPGNGGPSPDDIQALKAAQASGATQTQPPDIQAAAPIAAALYPPGPRPPAGPAVGGGGYGALGPQGWGVTAPGGGYNAGARRTDAAYGPYDAPVNPDAPAPAAQPVSAEAPRAAAPLPGPMANNDRFIGVDRPNADPTNARGGAPLGTALNLAGLFGGGQPAVNPNVPSAAAAPMSGGPLALGGMSKAPGSMGPLQKGMQWPSAMGPFKPKKGDARARILAPDLYG